MSVPGTVAVIGSANLDLVVTTAALPRPGETVHATGYQEFPGGKGSNQAVAAARMGAAVSFVGAVGRDAAGDLLRAALEAEGVSVDGLAVIAAPTGRALVMVDAGAENSIVIVGGANAEVGPDEVARASSTIDAAAVVVCQLEIPMDAVIAAAHACRGTFVLNPAPAQECDASLLALTDVLVVNEVEFECVLGRRLPDDLAELTGFPPPGVRGAVVVTLGGRGAAVWAGDDVRLLTAPAVEVVDTTGAGDTFVGALAAEMARGAGVLDAARLAVVAGSLSVRALGATSGMPDRDSVLAAAQPPS